jgi:terminase large subunit-like protein
MATKKAVPKQKTILDAMTDKELFRKTFRKPLLGRDSWASWKVFLSALFALPMSAEQKQIYFRHTKRTDFPAKPFRECFVIAGRRSGKSVIAALVAVFTACFVDHSESLAPGERGIVMVLSSDRRQAKIIFNYILALLQVPLLKGLIEAERKESIDLTNGITIQIQTASYRAVRGFTIVCAVADEIAFWADFDTGGSNPDFAILESIRPAMLTVPKALLLCISSPYARRGVLWHAYNNFFGIVSDTLVWQGPSGEMNPTLPASEIAKAYKKDPISASAEFGALFREDSNEFISLAMVMDRTARTVTQRSYDETKRFYAFTDPSGGKGDSAVLAIAHFEAEKQF